MTTVLQRQLQGLYVAWQDPTTMQYFPVGRLLSGFGPERPEYEFVYLQGALAARPHGFQPLLSFNDLAIVYRSSELFPFFQNRLMSTSRSEYPSHVQNLGLDPARADPMSILIRSGGARATDSIEMFEVPQLSPEGHPYQTHFLAHGIRYLHHSSHDRILGLRQGEPLFIAWDFQNPADSRALALRTEDRVLVGYMPRYLLPDAMELLTSCGTIECTVARVNPPPTVLQQRLLCRLEACWPETFKPFCTDHYRPISSEAYKLPCGWDQEAL